MNIFSEPGPFTALELAGACRVSEAFIRKLIASGTLRACRFGRLVRIPASAARDLATQLGVEPEATAPSAWSAPDAPSAPAETDARSGVTAGQ